MKSAARLGDSDARGGRGASAVGAASDAVVTDMREPYDRPPTGERRRAPTRPYDPSMASQQRPGIPLGRVAGVPIYLAPSWFIVALVVVVVFEPTVARVADVVRPQTFAVAALFAVLLLLSVLVHELSHAGVAMRLGMPVQEIVLTLWGGHTQFEDDAPAPGRSAAVAVVGPLSNGVLAGLGVLALTRVEGGVSSLLIGALVVTNAFVAVFNLAPGLPLDGGRVVESAIWAATGRRSTGTLVAGWCGRVVAVLVVLWALAWPLLNGGTPSLFSVIWSGLIAGMLWQGASSAIAVSRLRQEAERLDLRAFTVPAVASPVSTAAWQLLPAGSDVHVVAVDAGGTPVGVLEPQTRARLAKAGQPPAGTPLRAVMTVLDPVATLSDTATGPQVLSALSTRPAYVYVVVDGRGEVVGLARGQQLADAVTRADR